MGCPAPGGYSRCCCVLTSAPWLGCGPNPRSARRRCWAASALRPPGPQPAKPSPPRGAPWPGDGFLWSHRTKQWPGSPRGPGHRGAVRGDSSSSRQVCQEPGCPVPTTHLPATAPQHLPACLLHYRRLPGARARVRAGARARRPSVLSPDAPATGWPLPAAREEAEPGAARAGPRGAQDRL